MPLPTINYDRVTIMRLQRGRQDRYWRAELRGLTVTVISGDTGTPPGPPITKTYPTQYEALDAIDNDTLDKGRRGWSQITPEQLEELMRPETRPTVQEPTPAQREDGARLDAIRGDHPTSPVTRRPAPAVAMPDVVREGPYAQTFTGPTVFALRFGPATTGATKDDDPPRATSGGRPILAEGQRWPVCGYCDGQPPLSLYLQFDVEARFMLGIAPGSHVLLFHCTQCDTVPRNPRDLRLPESWLDEAHPSSYRVFVNPPTGREVAHPPDPIMNEQHVTFRAAKEKLTQTADGFVGKRKVKIGGVPHWVQPPLFPTCACGKPMGFVFQVPSTEPSGWATWRDPSPAFAGGLDAFVFACTGPCHPLAAVMIVQR